MLRNPTGQHISFDFLHFHQKWTYTLFLLGPFYYSVIVCPDLPALSCSNQFSNGPKRSIVCVLHIFIGVCLLPYKNIRSTQYVNNLVPSNLLHVRAVTINTALTAVCRLLAPPLLAVSVLLPFCLIAGSMLTQTNPPPVARLRINTSSAAAAACC